MKTASSSSSLFHSSWGLWRQKNWTFISGWWLERKGMWDSCAASYGQIM